MRDASGTESSRRKRWPVVLVTTGLLVGGAAVGAAGVAASAAPELSAASPSPSASTGTSRGHGHRGDETAVTGAKATTLKAAALKAVPGGTVLRVETDSDGAAYEVHVKQSDGTRVTVKFDSSLKQTAIETDTGERGHGDRGDETAVTGAKATTLKAAALKAVPGGTVLRMETDSDGAAYEVHVKQSDGTRVTVKFDSSLKQTAIETDTGKRGHGRAHRDDRSETAG